MYESKLGRRLGCLNWDWYSHIQGVWKPSTNEVRKRFTCPANFIHSGWIARPHLVCLDHVAGKHNVHTYPAPILVDKMSCLSLFSCELKSFCIGSIPYVHVSSVNPLCCWSTSRQFLCFFFFLTILISDSNSDISDYLRINVHNFDIILISSLLISIIVNYYYQNILFLDIEHMVRNDNIRIIMMSFYHS